MVKTQHWSLTPLLRDDKQYFHSHLLKKILDPWDQCTHRLSWLETHSRSHTHKLIQLIISIIYRSNESVIQSVVANALSGTNWSKLNTGVWHLNYETINNTFTLIGWKISDRWDQRTHILSWPNYFLVRPAFFSTKESEGIKRSHSLHAGYRLVHACQLLWVGKSYISVSTRTDDRYWTRILQCFCQPIKIRFVHQFRF